MTTIDSSTRKGGDYQVEEFAARHDSLADPEPRVSLSQGIQVVLPATRISLSEQGRRSNASTNSSLLSFSLSIET